MKFNFQKSTRNTVTDTIISRLKSIYDDPRKELVVNRSTEPAKVLSDANTFSFEKANDAEEVMLHVIEGIRNHGVQVTHPSYLGLFNPRPSFPSLMADVINSYLNPQLAAWSHAPFAVEIEQLVIKEFGKKFGYSEKNTSGIFCIGGSESNQTALLVAMQKHMPNVAEEGLVNTRQQPLIYASTESHHSMDKAARSAGLGTKSIRKILVNDDLTINIAALRAQIIADIATGHKPFMVVGTAGTTGAGAFDNLDQLSDVCKEFNLWLHADGAYGGGAIITDLKHYLKGIEKSDSITLDLHKWFSVPMGTSIFLTSDPDILSQTFNTKTDYMPEDGDPNRVFDYYVNSLQWSRRFLGLKIYLPLAVLGWDGYTSMLSHQIDMGHALRDMLRSNGWTIENQTELPIICFTHPDLDEASVQPLVDDINNSEKTWISSYPIHGKLMLRAQIPNYETQVEDLRAFMNLLSTYKQNYTKSAYETH